MRMQIHRTLATLTLPGPQHDGPSDGPWECSDGCFPSFPLTWLDVCACKQVPVPAMQGSDQLRNQRPVDLVAAQGPVGRGSGAVDVVQDVNGLDQRPALREGGERGRAEGGRG